MVKHNNVVPNAHFKSIGKACTCNIGSAARKKRRRLARKAEAAAIAHVQLQDFQTCC